MISSSIFNNPYSSGYPLVPPLTVIVVSVDDISEDRVVIPTITSDTKVSRFKYWSKFSAISTGPLWYSWEI